MAARTNQANDGFTLLHAGTNVTVASAGFNDPSGKPWILMNDTAAAVNGLIVTNAATGGAVTIGVNGPAADANPNLSIFAGSSTGTGTLLVGSSAGALTLSGTVTASQGLSFSSNLTVTGAVNASTFNASANVVATGNVTTASAFKSNVGASSSQLTAIQFGPSSFAATIQIGSSVPTAACNVGSLFLNAGGSSTTALYVCMPNGGTASSSNWDTITMT